MEYHKNKCQQKKKCKHNKCKHNKRVKCKKDKYNKCKIVKCQKKITNIIPPIDTKQSSASLFKCGLQPETIFNNNTTSGIVGRFRNPALLPTGTPNLAETDNLISMAVPVFCPTDKVGVYHPITTVSLDASVTQLSEEVDNIALEPIHVLGVRKEDGFYFVDIRNGNLISSAEYSTNDHNLFIPNKTRIVSAMKGTTKTTFSLNMTDYTAAFNSSLPTDAVAFDFENFNNELLNQHSFNAVDKPIITINDLIKDRAYHIFMYNFALPTIDNEEVRQTKQLPENTIQLKNLNISAASNESNINSKLNLGPEQVTFTLNQDGINVNNSNVELVSGITGVFSESNMNGTSSSGNDGPMISGTSGVDLATGTIAFNPNSTYLKNYALYGPTYGTKFTFSQNNTSTNIVFTPLGPNVTSYADHNPNIGVSMNFAENVIYLLYTGSFPTIPNNVDEIATITPTLTINNGVFTFTNL